MRSLRGFQRKWQFWVVVLFNFYCLQYFPCSSPSLPLGSINKRRLVQTLYISFLIYYDIFLKFSNNNIYHYSYFCGFWSNRILHYFHDACLLSLTAIKGWKSHYLFILRVLSPSQPYQALTKIPEKDQQDQWSDKTFTFSTPEQDEWKLKYLLRKPLSSLLPQAPPFWYKPPFVFLLLAKRS